MFAKIFVIALMLIILGSLGSGFYFLLHDGPGSTRIVKALSWRIGLSVAAFLLLLIAGWAGWIEPNAVQVR